jgi:hypothetical protein
MKISKAFLLLVIFTSLSCQKDEILPKSGYEEVTLKNLTGFDGCGFVFQKNDGNYLEPTNKKDFTIDYTDGKKYYIKYNIDNNTGSFCMVGKMIKIAELKEE